MIDGLEVETHQFRDADYVLIKVDIGKMPPHRAKEYIARLRDNTAICKNLDDRGIPYDLVGVRDNTPGMAVESKQEPEEVTMDADVKVRSGVGRSSKVEKLPSAQSAGLDGMDSMSHFRQNFMKALATTNVKKVKDSEPKNGKVTANRNDLLKVDSELKTDSFAEAMKLME